MDLKDYLSVSGQGGLFKMVSQAKSALIVEHLETKKRMPVYASQKVSSLEEISIFTNAEDKPLSEILVDLHKKLEGKPADNPKKASNHDLRTLFTEVVPDHDELRVYISDIKKILMWYNQLLEFTDLDWTIEEVEEKKEEKTKQEKAEEKDQESTD